MKQKHALDILKLGKNVFLTGPAGSGKTYVLNQYIAYLKESGIGVGITASTGIAATHIGGMTIHSWSGLHIRDSVTTDDLKDIAKKKYLKKRFTAASVVVIDEVSMLSSSQLDAVDMICQMFKGNVHPFGGMQVVLSGDLFQLPPIARRGESPRFVYESEIWEQAGIRMCYLEEQHRHEDDTLTSVLNHIRSGEVSEGTLDVLRRCYKQNLGERTPTKLYTHNIDVDYINAQELAALTGEAHTYSMEDEGPDKLVATLRKGSLAQDKLVLKKDAVVMFVKNNFNKGYVNGTLGKVVGFTAEGFPKVKTYAGETIYAEPEEWHIEEEGTTLAKIRQVPLRLAWAITVHKSQGMSLDAAEIDLSKSFVSGMGYVALSRVRTLAGLRLMGLNDTALSIDERLRKVDTHLQKKSEEVVSELEAMDESEKETEQNMFKELHATVTKKKKISAPSAKAKGAGTKPKSVVGKEKKPTHGTVEKTRELLMEQYSLHGIARTRELEEQTIVSHLEVLKEQGEAEAYAYLKPSQYMYESIAQAFEKAGDAKLASVKDMLGEQFTYTDIRLVRLFLDLDKAVY